MKMGNSSLERQGQGSLTAKCTPVKVLAMVLLAATAGSKTLLASDERVKIAEHICHEEADSQTCIESVLRESESVEYMTRIAKNSQ